MCLAIPLKLVEIDGAHGVVEMEGLKRKVNLSLVEGVKPGDYVIVHVGFAIALMDEKEARATLEMIREIMVGSPVGE